MKARDISVLPHKIIIKKKSSASAIIRFVLDLICSCHVLEIGRPVRD